jgi:formylglycine-generating enzyme required for sulfatase activity
MDSKVKTIENSGLGEMISIKNKNLLRYIFVIVGIVISVLVALGLIARNPHFQTSSTDKNIISKVDGMELIYVPTGDFVMGSENGAADESPKHEIYLDAFWIDKTEVTNEMYRKCIKDGTCEMPRSTLFINNQEFDDHPVVDVTWQDADNYCGWAGRQLPTEAQWEKAARGTDGRNYPWGNKWEDSFVNWAESRDNYRSTSPVGSFPDGASPYGALDMVGNVWEWVADWYGHDYYQFADSENPQGPINGFERAHRGGSWYDYQPNLRAPNRDRNTPHFPDLGIGFRCLVID